MKNLFSLIILLILGVACQEAEVQVQAVPEINVQAEIDKINQMRAEFEQTVREGRYQDLGKFVTSDMISVGPGSEDWIAYRKLREIHGDKFRYDSIKMRPKETVIVSDSVAYDFGVSSMYYSDEEGIVHELEDSFLVILKKDKSGVWKLHREMASSLVPENMK